MDPVVVYGLFFIGLQVASVSLFVLFLLGSYIWRLYRTSKYYHYKVEPIPEENDPVQKIDPIFEDRKAFYYEE
jgi:hypothetical protein